MSLENEIKNVRKDCDNSKALLMKKSEADDLYIKALKSELKVSKQRLDKQRAEITKLKKEEQVHQRRELQTENEKVGLGAG